MQTRILGLMALSGIFGVTSAGAAIMTFENVAPINGAQYPGTPHTEAGFTLTNATYGSDALFGAASGANTNGTAVFGWCGFCAYPSSVVITLTAVGGAAFNLNSLDAANLEQTSLTQFLDIVGYVDGGGTLAQQLTIGDTWTTFDLSGFNDLTSVEIFGAGVGPDLAMDNLVANVPEPATLSLLGFGLAGIGALRRRRKAS
ncbi:MAG: PEP-CTERM sorting domain-containing protein [Steroidobacteraceae bacterium]